MARLVVNILQPINSSCKAGKIRQAKYDAHKAFPWKPKSYYASAEHQTF